MASPFERAFNPAFQQASAAAMKSLDDERQENRFQQRMLEQRQYDASLLEGSKAYAANLLKDSIKIDQDRIDAATKLDAQRTGEANKLAAQRTAEANYPIYYQAAIKAGVPESKLKGMTWKDNATILEMTASETQGRETGKQRASTGALPTLTDLFGETPDARGNLKQFDAMIAARNTADAATKAAADVRRDISDEAKKVREEDDSKKAIQGSIEDTETLKELERGLGIPEGETIDSVMGQSRETIKARVAERSRQMVQLGISNDDSRKVIGALLGDNALKLGVNEGNHLLRTKEGGINYKNAAAMTRYIKRSKVEVGNNESAAGAFSLLVDGKLKTYKWEEDWIPPSLKWGKSGRKIVTLQDFIDSRDGSEDVNERDIPKDTPTPPPPPKPLPKPLPKPEGTPLSKGPDTQKWVSKAFGVLTGGTPEGFKHRDLGRTRPVPDHRGIGELRSMERFMPQGEPVPQTEGNATLPPISPHLKLEPATNPPAARPTKLPPIEEPVTPLPSLPGEDVANEMLDAAMGRANDKISKIEAELRGEANPVIRDQKFLQIGLLLNELKKLKYAREFKE